MIWCGWRDLNHHALRRQNLNSANTFENQSHSSFISQDKAETKGETAKQSDQPPEKKSPGARAGATGISPRGIVVDDARYHPRKRAATVLARRFGLTPSMAAVIRDLAMIGGAA